MPEENVVSLRVQVIDLKSFTLDLQVPTFLPARDLTQRISRDAGLDAFWPDGRRRLYWLRARGRLLRDDEKLQDLDEGRGVVNGELVYLLPEPPPNTGVIEQVPEYPITHGYAGAGYLAILGSMVMMVMWAVGWGVALMHDRGLLTVLAPGLAMGLFCCSLARHFWGGRGNQLRIAVTGLTLQMILTVFVFLPPIFFGDAEIRQVLIDGVPGVIMGMLGVLLGWLAWWGAVEPLPPVQVQQAEQAQVQALVPCGICNGGVEQSVRAECPHNCGQFFHSGCLKARQSVYRGDRSRCAVCGRQVA